APSRDESTSPTPSAASASAMPRPIPLLAALTSATRPCNPYSIRSSSPAALPFINHRLRGKGGFFAGAQPPHPRLPSRELSRLHQQQSGIERAAPLRPFLSPCHVDTSVQDTMLIEARGHALVSMAG